MKKIKLMFAVLFFGFMGVKGAEAYVSEQQGGSSLTLKDMIEARNHSYNFGSKGVMSLLSVLGCEMPYESNLSDHPYAFSPRQRLLRRICREHNTNFIYHGDSARFTHLVQRVLHGGRLRVLNIFAFRGTQDQEDINTDIKGAISPMDPDFNVPSAYLALLEKEKILEYICNELKKGESDSIFIGHSLGGACASIAIMKTLLAGVPAAGLNFVTFGAPPAMHTAPLEYLRSRLPQSSMLNIFRANDPIPSIYKTLKKIKANLKPDRDLAFVDMSRASGFLEGFVMFLANAGIFVSEMADH